MSTAEADVDDGEEAVDASEAEAETQASDESDGRGA